MSFYISRERIRLKICSEFHLAIWWSVNKEEFGYQLVLSSLHPKVNLTPGISQPILGRKFYKQYINWFCYWFDILASINMILQSMTYNLQSFWESYVTKCTTFAIISSILVILQSWHDLTKYGLQFTIILRNLSYRTYN